LPIPAGRLGASELGLHRPKVLELQAEKVGGGRRVARVTP
jgi:hypothetical protein